MKINTLVKTGAVLVLSVAFATQATPMDDPGGKETTFTHINGHEIMHPLGQVKDGKGTQHYLAQFCRAKVYDRLVRYKIKKYTYASEDNDGNAIWLESAYEPRIYESVTCFIDLN